MLTSSMLGPATDREIDALQQAVQWPNAAPGALLAFTTQLVAAGRYERGLQHFRRAAQAQPQNPVLRALAGYFAVLSADVERGIADLTWACERQPGLPHYLRGLAVAELPLDADHARGVVADLELVLALRDHLPTGFMRGAHRALALAYRTLGRDDDARAAQRRSGLDGVSDDVRLLFTDYWANPNDGFRFHSPRLLQPATGVHLAQGYDFGDFALAETSSRPVAIDAGSTSTRVRAALTDLETPGPVGHVILTHAHWDHIGGLDALAGANTQIIAQSQFPAELALQHHSHLPYRYFLGTEGRLDHHVTPDHLIDSPSELTIGGRRFTLIPVTGGETSDALLVHLPEERLTFTGDVLMPYLGAPFFPEGNPQALLDTLQRLRELRPTQLIHGHAPLTATFTVDCLDGLHHALTDLTTMVLDAIHAGAGLAAILHRNHLPESLREHPAAVMPYLITRDNFTSRLHHQHTGYWKPDGQGIHTFSAHERAAALNLVANGQVERFYNAADVLLTEGHAALALETLDSGLLAHPQDPNLVALRQTVLLRLMERHQQFDPFRFLIYTERSGTELAPVQ